MASDAYVRQAKGVFTGTCGSTAIPAGAPVYFDGTDWELADADDNTKFAEAISCGSYAAAEVGAFCTSCIIVDIDAPYTQGDQYYLSTTAGSITSTRPTGANNLKQVLGFGLSTSELRCEVGMVKEETINVPMATGGATSASGQNGDWTGTLLAAASDPCGGAFMFPENCVGIEIAYLWHTNGASAPALDASDTITIDVSAGVDDETTTATTDGITATALTVADNDLNRIDISTAFDGTGIVEAGNVASIDVTKAAEGGAGDDPLMLCASIVILTV